MDETESLFELVFKFLDSFWVTGVRVSCTEVTVKLSASDEW